MSGIPSLRLQSGIGIVEIMVAMAISLFLVAGLAQIFVSNKQSYRVHQAQSRLQENARVASVLLGSGIERAGFHQNAEDDASAVFSGANIALTGTNNNANAGDQIRDGTDTITLRFQGDGVITDCQGALVGAGVIATNTYRVDTNNVLQCDNGTGFQPLLSSVENMQILYGEDTDSDGAVDQYVNAASVTNFDSVFAVHTALLLASEEDVKPVANSQTFALLDGTVTAPPAGTDQIQRRVIERVISLRNRLL